MIKEEDQDIALFRSFLSIPSISYEGTRGSYRQAVEFLEKIAKDIGLITNIIEPVLNKPILIVSWVGTDPKLSSILLNSHYDVVPVDETQWHYPPFKATLLDDGKIIGRGSQDMKCICVMYLQAIRRIKLMSLRCCRTIHLSFMPDEEIGGKDGMAKFIETEIFSSLNIGLVLDEGLPCSRNQFIVYNGERSINWLIVKSIGNTGHASSFIPDTASSKILKFISMMDYYRSEQEKLSLSKFLGDIVTLNLTMLNLGINKELSHDFSCSSYTLNVIPNQAQAGFDIRLPPSISIEQFEKSVIHPFAEKSGITYEWKVKSKSSPVTRVDEEYNIWNCFLDTGNDFQIPINSQIFPAATDSRYIRQLGIPVYGFSPLRKLPVLLHDNDEYIYTENFKEGIAFYVNLITRLGNVGCPYI